jgi:uncharacterized membrane protein (Fun14 family)
MMGILQGQVAGSGIWRPAGRWFLNNIELILTAVGIGVILLSGFVASRSAFSLETATAVSATLVGVIHGILFWLLRRRQRQVRREAIGQIREMLGCVDLSFEPKESTDEIEKTQEVPGQFVKTRK